MNIIDALHFYLDMPKDQNQVLDRIESDISKYGDLFDKGFVYRIAVISDCAKNQSLPTQNICAELYSAIHDQLELEKDNLNESKVNAYINQIRPSHIINAYHDLSGPESMDRLSIIGSISSQILVESYVVKSILENEGIIEKKSIDDDMENIEAKIKFAKRSGHYSVSDLSKILSEFGYTLKDFYGTRVGRSSHENLNMKIKPNISINHAAQLGSTYEKFATTLALIGESIGDEKVNFMLVEESKKYNIKKSDYVTTERWEKALYEAIKKDGIIGHTSSGKPVYNDKEAGDESYSDFTMKDHQEAGESHGKIADNTRSRDPKNEDAMIHHNSIAMDHYSHADKLYRSQKPIKEDASGNANKYKYVIISGNDNFKALNNANREEKGSSLWGPYSYNYKDGKKIMWCSFVGRQEDWDKFFSFLTANGYTFTVERENDEPTSHVQITEKSRNRSIKETIYRVKWTDRDYKDHHKDFKDDPGGAAENGLQKARNFSVGLNKKDKESIYGLYRLINIETINEDMADDNYYDTKSFIGADSIKEESGLTADKLKIGDIYKIDSGLGGVFDIKYNGVNQGKHEFENVSKGWTKDKWSDPNSAIYRLTDEEVSNEIQIGTPRVIKEDKASLAEKEKTLARKGKPFSYNKSKTDFCYVNQTDVDGRYELCNSDGNIIYSGKHIDCMNAKREFIKEDKLSPGDKIKRNGKTITITHVGKRVAYGLNNEGKIIKEMMGDPDYFYDGTASANSVNSYEFQPPYGYNDMPIIEDNESKDKWWEQFAPDYKNMPLFLQTKDGDIFKAGIYHIKGEKVPYVEPRADGSGVESVPLDNCHPTTELAYTTNKNKPFFESIEDEESNNKWWGSYAPHYEGMPLYLQTKSGEAFKTSTYHIKDEDIPYVERDGGGSVLLNDCHSFWDEKLRVYIPPTNQGITPKIGDKIMIVATNNDNIEFLHKVGKITGYDDELLYRLYDTYFQDPGQEQEFYSHEFIVLQNAVESRKIVPVVEDNESEYVDDEDDEINTSDATNTIKILTDIVDKRLPKFKKRELSNGVDYVNDYSGNTDATELSFNIMDNGYLHMFLHRKIETSSISLADPRAVYQTTSAREVKYKTTKVNDVYAMDEIDVAMKKLNKFIDKIITITEFKTSINEDKIDDNVSMIMDELDGNFDLHSPASNNDINNMINSYVDIDDDEKIDQKDAKTISAMVKKQYREKVRRYKEEHKHD